MHVLFGQVDWGPHLLVLLAFVVPLVGKIPQVSAGIRVPTAEEVTEKSTGKEISWQIFQLVGSFAAMFTLMVYGINPEDFAALQFASQQPWGVWSGAAVAVAGVGISVWGRVVLGRNWVGGYQLHADHALVTRGPYRWVRHPMYSGFLLTVVGLTLATYNLLPLITEGVFRLMLAIRATREEAHLAARFGDEYHAYRARAGKFFPRLRRRRSTR